MVWISKWISVIKSCCWVSFSFVCIFRLKWRRGMDTENDCFHYAKVHCHSVVPSILFVLESGWLRSNLDLLTRAHYCTLGFCSFVFSFRSHHVVYDYTPPFLGPNIFFCLFLSFLFFTYLVFSFFYFIYLFVKF